MKQSALYFLFKVFHKSGSCYTKIPISWSKLDGYTMLH